MIIIFFPLKSKVLFILYELHRALASAIQELRPQEEETCVSLILPNLEARNTWHTSPAWHLCSVEKAHINKCFILCMYMLGVFIYSCTVICVPQTAPIGK